LAICRSRKTIVFVGYLAVLFTIALAIGEIILRMRGFHPMERDLGLLVVPSQAHMYGPDPDLGYTLVPNQKITITHTRTMGTTSAPPLTWSFTTSSSGHRMTHAPNFQTSGKEIWMFGCSFTFGWSVSDDDSFPWLLQEDLPGYEVINFGTPGYGTLQGLIQFEEELGKGKTPELVVLFYARFHNERNTLAPLYRRLNGFAWTRWGEREQPYVSWADGKMERKKGPITYEPVFPFVQTSALMNGLDFLVVSERERKARADDHRDEITEKLVSDFASLSKKVNAGFLVAELLPSGSDEMKRFCSKQGISYVPVEPAEWDQNMQSPYDGHPNARAHREFARLALPAIREALKATAN